LAALDEGGPAVVLAVAYRDRQYNMHLDVKAERRSIPELVHHALEQINRGIQGGWL
jgi:hypothetical protein